MGGLFGGKKKPKVVYVQQPAPRVQPLEPIAPAIPVTASVNPPAPMAPLNIPSPGGMAPLPISQSMVDQNPSPPPVPLPAGTGASAGQGVEGGGGATNPAQFPFSTPPADEPVAPAPIAPNAPPAMPQPIPFMPNSPTSSPQSFQLGEGGDAEEFITNFSDLQTGPGGITGGRGLKRGSNQSEADFLRQLIASGLFG